MNKITQVLQTNRNQISSKELEGGKTMEDKQKIRWDVLPQLDLKISLYIPQTWKANGREKSHIGVSTTLGMFSSIMYHTLVSKYIFYSVHYNFCMYA